MNKDIYKLLIVEDESVIREDIVSKISSHDSRFVILEASNGKEALEIMDKSVDAVITDINMPVMNGLELIEILRNQYPGTIIVVISGYDDFFNVKTAMKLGAIDYILKPVITDVIANLIISIQKLIDDLRNTNSEDAHLAHLIAAGVNDSNSYYEFILNLGNFHSPMLDKNQLHDYYIKLSSDRYKKIIIDTLGKAKVQFIPEPIINRVLVLIRGSLIQDFSNIVSNIYDKLKDYFSPIPITIVYKEEPISAKDCYICTHTLRNKLDSHIIACKSQLINSNSESDFPKHPNVNIIKAQLAHLIENEEYSKFKSQFVSYFSRPGYCDLPQFILENMLRDLSFFNSGTFANRLSQNDANTLNYGITRICSFTEDYHTLLIQVSSFVCDFYSRFNLTTESGDSIVNYLISYIREHYNAPFCLEEFAKKYNFNSTYLIRLFHSKTGATPNKYIINLRMEKAKQLLESNSELSIKQISELCGYDDQHYFSRLFKAQCGVNPTSYRENL